MPLTERNLNSGESHPCAHHCLYVTFSVPLARNSMEEKKMIHPMLLLEITWKKPTIFRQLQSSQGLFFIRAAPELNDSQGCSCSCWDLLLQHCVSQNFQKWVAQWEAIRGKAKRRGERSLSRAKYRHLGIRPLNPDQTWQRMLWSEGMAGCFWVHHSAIMCVVGLCR